MSVALVEKIVSSPAGILNDAMNAIRTGDVLRFAAKVPKSERTSTTETMIVRVDGIQVRRYCTPVVVGNVTSLHAVGNGTFRCVIAGEPVTLSEVAYTVRMVNPARDAARKGEIADEE